MPWGLLAEVALHDALIVFVGARRLAQAERKDSPWLASPSITRPIELS
jgi:hypothetical protein